MCASQLLTGDRTGVPFNASIARQGYPGTSLVVSFVMTHSSDRDAIDLLFRVEAPRLRRYFRRRMRAGEDASDLVQEAFVRLASAARGTMPARPAAYLQRIAANILIDRFRRESPSCVEFDEQDISARATQEDDLHLQDVMRIYETALAALPERTRTVFLLYRTEDMCYREIAAQLGISIPAVQNHMAKALEKIALAMRDED